MKLKHNTYKNVIHHLHVAVTHCLMNIVCVFDNTGIYHVIHKYDWYIVGNQIISLSYEIFLQTNGLVVTSCRSNNGCGVTNVFCRKLSLCNKHFFNYYVFTRKSILTCSKCFFRCFFLHLMFVEYIISNNGILYSEVSYLLCL